MKKLLVITGYGPGLGEALKQRFEKDNYQVIGLSRRSDIAADLTDASQTQAAFEQITKQYGTPDVVIHNVTELARGSFTELTANDFERAWKSIVLSAINVGHTAIPSMVEQQSGLLNINRRNGKHAWQQRFCSFQLGQICPSRFSPVSGPRVSTSRFACNSHYFGWDYLV